MTDEEIDADGRPRRQLPTEINIQVTAPLFTARLYDYGEADGDKQVPASVDVGMRLALSNPILFFGQKYKDIYVLSNGGIGFEQNSRNYKTNIVTTGPAIIAPLWNRNDMRKGGQIFYREITEGRAVERAQSEVRYQYDKNVKPISVVLVTWVNMQPNGDQKISIENTNTAQIAIINTENATYANLIYKSIGWSQGAEAGFGKGDGQSFYSLPSSGTDNIMYLKDYGNTGIPGEWIFEIGQDKIIRCKPGIKGDTCDDECAEFEWGPDCASCCQCAKGRCNVQTGECNGNECKQCWTNGPLCNKREADCKARQKDCGFNAISFTDYDHCGEPLVRCQCLSGYVGDGFNCTDVNECVKKKPCDVHATCINTPGRYYCECKPGFTGNGTSCTAFETTASEITEKSTISSLADNLSTLLAVSDNKVSTSPVTDDKASTSPVTFDKVSTGPVTDDKVSTGLVTGDKISVGTSDLLPTTLPPNFESAENSAEDTKQTTADVDEELEEFFKSVTSLNVLTSDKEIIKPTKALIAPSSSEITTEISTLGTNDTLVFDWLSTAPAVLHSNNLTITPDHDLYSTITETTNNNTTFVSTSLPETWPTISPVLFEEDNKTASNNAFFV